MNISPNKIKNYLIGCIKNMRTQKDRFVKNPDRNFIRESKCGLETTAEIILGFENQCLGSELANHFSSRLQNLPYKSAFVQQRDKFTDDAFRNLFEDFNATVPFTKTRYGLHIVAADGTDVNIPAAFGDKMYFVENHTKNGKGFYQFHGNAFIDICEDRFTDFVIQPRPEFNEGEAFLTMLERANHAADYSTLYVCDRNYFTWNTAAHILVKRQYFLIRAKGMRSSRSTFKGIEMPESGEFDVDASIKIIRSSKKYYKERPNEYRCVSRSLKFDFLDEGDDVSTFPIDFRIVCIRLKSGEYEYLLTNLPRDKFPPHVISELYKLRWKCELGFRKLKFNCGLNSFHSVKRNFIIQEVYARLIMYNYTSLVMAQIEVRQDAKFKHEHKLSFANATKVARIYLTTQMTIETLTKMLIMGTIPIRDSRSYGRVIKSRRVVPLNTRM